MENRERYTFFFATYHFGFHYRQASFVWGDASAKEREGNKQSVSVGVFDSVCLSVCVCVGNSKEQSGQGQGHVLFVFNSCQAAAELQFRLRFRRGQTRQAAQGAGHRCLCPSTPCSPSTTLLLCLIGYLSCSGGTGDFITLISSNATSSSWAKGNKCPWN